MQEVIDQLNVAVSIYDKDGLLVACNNSFIEIFDLPGEMTQKGPPLAQAIRLLAERGEYGPVNVDEFVSNALESLRIMEGQLIFERCRPDGRYYESKTSRLLNGNYITTFAEITHRKQREKELEASVTAHKEEVFGSKKDLNETQTEISLILKNAPHGILTVVPSQDSKIRVMRRVNLAMGRMLGYEEGELEGLSTCILYANDDAYNIVTSAYLEIISIGKTYHGESVFRRKDGQTIVVALSGSAIDPNDLPRGAIWFVEDITERKRIEAELAEKSSLLKNGIDNMPGGMVIWDKELRYKLWTPNTERLWNIPEGMLQSGLSLTDMFHFYAERGDYGSGDPAVLAEKRLLPFRERESIHEEHHMPNGTILDVRRNPLPNGGYVSVFIDITSLKQMETELKLANAELSAALDDLKKTQNELLRSEKLAALGSLVAGVAHELNTPIGNSLIAASTLQEQTDSVVQALSNGIKRSTLENYLNDAGNAADLLMRNLRRAAELVSSFKQVAVDQTSSQRRPFGLHEVTSEIIVTLRPTIKKTPYLIGFEISENIQMDSFPGPLGQVVTNLINNAIIHGFDGEPKGTVRISARKLNEDLVEMKLSDNGKGIPAANIDRIFDPFFTTRMGKGGSGLGLNIVHTIVTGVLGGDISVESEVGSGTTFTLSLPLVAPTLEKTQEI